MPEPATEHPTRLTDGDPADATRLADGDPADRRAGAAPGDVTGPPADPGVRRRRPFHPLWQSFPSHPLWRFAFAGVLAVALTGAGVLIGRITATRTVDGPGAVDIQRVADGPWRSRGPLVRDRALLDRAVAAWLRSGLPPVPAGSAARAAVAVRWAGTLASGTYVVFSGTTSVGGRVAVLRRPHPDEGFRVVGMLPWAQRPAGDAYPLVPLGPGDGDARQAQDRLLVPAGVTGAVVHTAGTGAPGADRLPVRDGLVTRVTPRRCSGVLYALTWSTEPRSGAAVLYADRGSSVVTQPPIPVRMAGGTDPARQAVLARALFGPGSCPQPPDTPGLRWSGTRDVARVTVLESAPLRPSGGPPGTMLSIRRSEYGLDDFGVWAQPTETPVRADAVWVPDATDLPVVWGRPDAGTGTWRFTLPGPGQVIVAALTHPGAAVEPRDRLLAVAPTGSPEPAFAVLRPAGPRTILTDRDGNTPEVVIPAA